MDPFPWDSDNGSFVSLNYYSGSWYINGVEQYLSGGTEDWSDSDGDYLPDSVDPYPYDPTNNSTWWEGIGIWIDGEYREYESRWMATSNVFDSDGDGLPDFIDPYPDSASNIYVELQYWNEWR